MTTVADVSADIAATDVAIATWRLPEAFVDRLRDDDARATWERLRVSVVSNSGEGLRAARTVLARGTPRDVDAADELVGRVQRRWRLWLQQVSRASRERIITPPAPSERVDAAMTDYYDDVTALVDALPSPSQLSAGVVLGGVALVFLVLSRR